MIYPNPQIYHHLKTIFVHVPKTAGTSIERALCASSNDLVGGHTTALGYRRKFGDLFTEYWKFAVVRHPVDRFISAYFYLLQRPIHPALGNEVVHSAGSLEAFVGRLETDAPLVHNIVHLKPQHTFVCDARLRLLVDTVFKFENLSDVWGEICARTGLRPVPLPRANRSRHENWRAYASPRLLSWVRSVYAEDMTLFGYEEEDVRLKIGKMTR